MVIQMRLLVDWYTQWYIYLLWVCLWLLDFQKWRANPSWLTEVYLLRWVVADQLNRFETSAGARDQGGRIKDLEFTSSHKCIKNTSTRGVILTDCLLDTNKSHIESKLPESSPCTGRVKIKGIRMRQSYTPGRNLWKRKDSFTLGTPFTNWEISWAEGEIQRLGRESAAGLEQAEQIETSTNGPGHLAAYPRLRVASAGVHSGSVVKLRLQQIDLSIGLQLAMWRQLEGARVLSRLQLGVCTEQSLSPLQKFAVMQAKGGAGAVS